MSAYRTMEYKEPPPPKTFKQMIREKHSKVAIDRKINYEQEVKKKAATYEKILQEYYEEAMKAIVKAVEEGRVDENGIITFTVNDYKWTSNKDLAVMLKKAGMWCKQFAWKSELKIFPFPTLWQRIKLYFWEA